MQTLFCHFLNTLGYEIRCWPILRLTQYAYKISWESVKPFRRSSTTHAVTREFYILDETNNIFKKTHITKICQKRNKGSPSRSIGNLNINVVHLFCSLSVWPFFDQGHMSWREFDIFFLITKKCSAPLKKFFWNTLQKILLAPTIQSTHR